MFNCNGYIKQSERLNKKNENYCNGRMHAALNKSPATMCLQQQNNNNNNNNKKKNKKKHIVVDRLKLRNSVFAVLRKTQKTLKCGFDRNI